MKDWIEDEDEDRLPLLSMRTKIAAASICFILLVVLVASPSISTLVSAVSRLRGDVFTDNSEVIIGLGLLEDAALSPEGTYLATCSNSAIHIWSLNGSCVLVIPAEGVAWVSVAWSPHGTMIAGADEKGRISVYSLANGSRISQTTYQHGSTRATSKPGPLGPLPVEWSPNGSIIAHGWMGGEVELFNPYTGSHLATLMDEAYSAEGVFEVGVIAWSADNELLAAVLSPGCFESYAAILVYNITSRDAQLQYTVNCNHRYPETGASFLPDNKLVWGGGEGRIQIHDQKGEAISSINLGSLVTALTTSPGGEELVIGSVEGDIIILSPELEEVTRIRKDKLAVFSFSWQGPRIASITSDSKITIWGFDQTRSIREIREFSGWGEPVGNVKFYPDGQHILSTHLPSKNFAGYYESTGSIRCYDIDKDGGEVLRIIPGSMSTDLSLDGRMIATLGQGEVNIYDAIYGSLATRIYTTLDRYCRWNPAKPGLLALAGYNGLEIWNVTEAIEPVLTIPGNHYVAMDWAGNGELIALGEESSVEVWDLTRPVMLASAQTWSDIIGIAFSPNGSLIACLSRKGMADIVPEKYREAGSSLAKVTVWRVNKWGGDVSLSVLGEVYLPRMLRDPNTCLAWSPNSTLLAVATGTPRKTYPDPDKYGPSWDGVMILRESLGGLRAVINLTGPTRPVSSVDWLSDGSALVAGCQDGTIRIWGIESGEDDPQIIGKPFLYLLFLPALTILLCLTRLYQSSRGINQIGG